MMYIEKWKIIKKQTKEGLKTDKIVKDERCSIEIQHLIEGCFLGDGYINKYGALTIEHSVNQKPGTLPFLEITLYDQCRSINFKE